MWVPAVGPSPCFLLPSEPDLALRVTTGAAPSQSPLSPLPPHSLGCPIHAQVPSSFYHRPASRWSLCGSVPSFTRLVFCPFQVSTCYPREAQVALRRGVCHRQFTEDC